MLYIGDVVKTSEDKIAVVTSRETTQGLTHYAIQPLDNKGKWAWWDRKELQLVEKGPIRKYPK